MDSIFSLWSSMNSAEFLKQMSWYRVFEQLVVTRNDALLPFHKQIAAFIKLMNSNLPFFRTILEALEPPSTSVKPGIVCFEMPPTDVVTVYHGSTVTPKDLYEAEWLEDCVGKPIVYRPYEEARTATTAENPLLLFLRDRSSAANEAKSLAERDAILAALRDRPVKLLHLSDEFATDDIAFYGQVSRVFRNYWRRGLPTHATVIPLGYARGRHGRHYSASTLPFTERPTVWSFAGSLDREGRDDALSTLRTVRPYVERSKASWDSTPALDARAYNDMLRTTKFVPCFRGSCSLESYRLYEALEQGAIPIYVPAESNGCADEWRELLGSHPFLGFPSWDKAAELLPMLCVQTEAMERHRLACAEWWETKKAQVRRLFA